MTAKKTDNRARPHILRVLPAVNARVRAYADRQGLAPNVAAEDLINAAAAEVAALAGEVARLTADLATANETGALTARALDVARAELDSAREATRRADAEIERLTRELTISEENTAAAVRLVNRRESELTEVRAALATKGAADRIAERVETIAAALPDDFEAKLAERAPGWKGTPAELRARVITLGFSRYDALATDAAKRAAERGR